MKTLALVQSKKSKTTNPVEKDANKCPYCGGLVILNTLTGEYVCTNCGTVLDVLYLPPKISNKP